MHKNQGEVESYTKAFRKEAEYIAEKEGYFSAQSLKSRGSDSLFNGSSSRVACSFESDGEAQKVKEEEKVKNKGSEGNNVEAVNEVDSTSKWDGKIWM